MPNLNKAKIRIIFQTSVLLGVILFCYAPSLGSFFVADDIWQVNFAHKVFEGRTELILRNFTSNYLQLPSFGFYRPLLGFTFLFDYFFWATNAVGYHITSLLLYGSAVWLLFLLVRTMTRTWPDFNSSWTAFFSALLFAVTPLHCEDVTWISGRADLLAAPFYLLCLLMFVKGYQRGNNKRFYFASLLSFVCALLSKEISIGLPLVIGAYVMVWPKEEEFANPLDATKKPLVVSTADESGETTPTNTDETSVASGTSTALKQQQRPMNARQVAHYERAVKKGKKKKKKTRHQGTAGGGSANVSDEIESDESGTEPFSADSAATATPPDSDKANSEASKTPVSAKANSEASTPTAEHHSLASHPDSKKSIGALLLDHFKIAVKLGWPYAVIGGIYMLVRYKVLGEFIGGYGGMMGGALGRHLILRWFDPVNISRIMLPYPASISTTMMIPQWVTGICLVTCVCIVLIRLLAQARPWRWLLFLIIWMATAILPLAKLWGVGMELETSRLLFMFTMAYSILWPVLLFHPPRKGAPYSLPASANRNLGFVSALVFVVMSVTMTWASYRTNTFWLVAGSELKSIWLQTQKLVEGLNKDEKVMVLGIPKDYKGAHVNFNGSTFHHMLRPPFTASKMADRVLTFEPFIIGPFEVINTDRFKALLNSPKVKGPYVWNRNSGLFDPIKFGGQRGMPEELSLPFRASEDTPVKSIWKYHGKGTSEVRGNGLVMHDTDDGAALQIEKLDISPLEYDFIEFKIRGALKETDPRVLVPMAVGWNSMSVKKDRYENWSVMALNVPKMKENNEFRLHLSHFWQWFSAGTIKSFVIRLFEADTIEVSDVKLLKADKIVPFAGLKDLEPLNTGEYVIGKEPLVLLFDGQNIPNAESVEIEVTKPNYFFDNYLMGTRETAVNHVLQVGLNRGATVLKQSFFEEPAYYEIRVRCLDAEKKPVGEWSDSVTVMKMGEG
ncbi:hypothetical protein KF707_21870, partial [Candidatus Obscuribacterales bacterium]|nr:hypothetical protein [Candidatus Obscuribacterales bacterium]